MRFVCSPWQSLQAVWLVLSKYIVKLKFELRVFPYLVMIGRLFSCIVDRKGSWDWLYLFALWYSRFWRRWIAERFRTNDCCLELGYNQNHNNEFKSPVAKTYGQSNLVNMCSVFSLIIQGEITRVIFHIPALTRKWSSKLEKLILFKKRHESSFLRAKRSLAHNYFNNKLTTYLEIIKNGFNAHCIL